MLVKHIPRLLYQVEINFYPTAGCHGKGIFTGEEVQHNQINNTVCFGRISFDAVDHTNFQFLLSLSLCQPTPLTSLHVAAREGDNCTVKYLVKEGADVNDTDNNGVNVTILLAAWEQIVNCSDFHILVVRIYQSFNLRFENKL